MSLFGFLLAWYNLPFIVALGCCMVFALLQVVGGASDNDADADVDVDGDMDVDVDADMELDVDADIDGDLLDVPHDAPDPQAGQAPSGLQSLLWALGIGRVPLMLVLMAFLGSFGAVGLLGNTLLSTMFNGYPAVALIPMLVGGTILALLLTGRISRLLGRLAPRSSTAITSEQLVGRVGVVVSPSVSSSYGRVQVRDNFGSLHTVYAVIEAGQPVPEQSEVALLSYDASQRYFIVRPLGRHQKAR